MPIQDVEIILNAKVDIPAGNMQYVEFDETAPYVSLLGGGIIEITDFPTTFPQITSKVVKLDVWIETTSGWQDASVFPTGITYDSGLIKTISWYLGQTGILKLNGKIY